MPDTQTYVTWKQFIITITTLVAMLFGGFWSILENHRQQPHQGAVYVREFRTLSETHNNDMNKLIASRSKDFNILIKRIEGFERKLDNLITIQLQNKRR